MSTRHIGVFSLRLIFTNQIIGLKFDDCALKKDGGEVDKITGATKGSKTVVDMVRETALEKVKSIR